MAIDKILVTGANGQLGTVLVSHLGAVYGHANVIATDIRHPLEPHPTAFEILDALDASAVNDVIKRHRIKIVYHLAAVLSAKGEENPLATWHLNTQSFLNILEVARIERFRRSFFQVRLPYLAKILNAITWGRKSACNRRQSMVLAKLRVKIGRIIITLNTGWMFAPCVILE